MRVEGISPFFVIVTMDIFICKGSVCLLHSIVVTLRPGNLLAKSPFITYSCLCEATTLSGLIYFLRFPQL